MARVSVTVPTFNRVGYLDEAIASILRQDYRDFELVPTDNASTDGTERGPARQHARRHCRVDGARGSAVHARGMRRLEDVVDSTSARRGAHRHGAIEPQS
jgi:GT2 family glycosyltransferase